ncbi:ABC transporter substrate-binding protein [Phytohabitans flavus]|uniref:ABC transporter substrate-binding protein n=1 Tax=Phytohabitans flavus TaxID=1076124 RepID=A0A6F8XTM7_9ACTN|nr:ABC transporter substrate-binding protein [Phytohabitans flavus]BCB77176.1 ABC transporter substrate-binding protein [Phytohabitans flavus]
MRVRGVAVLVACLLAAAGCSGGDGESATDRPTPTELRLAIGGESEDGYDPTLGWGRYGSPLFQSTLLKLDTDLKIVNDLATGYQVSPDGLKWTVSLRDDAVFTDGKPVTAGDVAYTFVTAKQQPGLTDVSALATATATNDTTVEFVLQRPQSTFVYRLASLGIVPEHAHGADYAQRPIGSGPFTFVQWDKGQQLIVQRNEKYYGDKPSFERIVFLFTDEDGTLAAARAGQVQLASVPSTLVTGDIQGMTLVKVPSIDNRGVMFPYVPDDGRKTDKGAPIGNDVTSDRAIRPAVNLAANRQVLVEGVLHGYGSPATGPADGAPWYEPRSAITDNKPDDARSLLDAAGWKDADGDGVREKAGVEAAFTVLYPADDTLRQGLAVALADQVAPVGIRIEPKAATWEEIEQRMHTDAVLFGWGSHDPTEMYNLYSSRQAGVEYWNTGFYANPDVDRHLDAALSTADPEAANAEWRAAQLDASGNGFAASADAAWAWLVNLDHVYYTNTCLGLGKPQTEPHGHGWPITAGIARWTWTC